MELNTREILKKKILDAQEMVRDYEVYSKEVEDVEIAKAFRDFAEECGYQASNMQKILEEMD